MIARLVVALALAGTITPEPTVSLSQKHPRPYWEFQMFDADGTPIPDTHAQGIQCGPGLACSTVELDAEGQTKLRLRIDKPTATPTAGAGDCCQGFVGFNVCGPASTSHCLSGSARTPVYGAMCSSGLCVTFTPTPTP